MNLIKKVSLVGVGIGTGGAALLTALASHAAVNTSTVQTAINSGVDAGGQQILDTFTANLPTIMIVGGFILAALVVWRFLRKVAR